jgi:hypothetical protein
LWVVLLVVRVLWAWGGFGSQACLDRIHRVRQSLGSGTACQACERYQ